MGSQLAFEGERELRWLELGECLVTYVEAEVELADSLWDKWMDSLREPTVTRLMLCSWGPTQPSHQQWRRATRLMRDLRMPVAVVTNARHNLALAKAAAWLGTNMQAYRWHQLNEACELLGFGKDEKVAAKAKIIALRDRFGPVTTNPETGGSGYANRGYASTMPLAASSELVLETSSEIQAKLREIQARLQARLS